jgi:CBS domain-containing protein
MKTINRYMKKRVVYVKPTDSLFEVAKTFSRRRISGAPVVEKQKVVGIISESDIISFMKTKLPDAHMMSEEPHALTVLVANFVKEGIDFIREVRKISKCSVQDYMNRDIISITPDAGLLEAAEVMAKNSVDRLPVIDQGKLKGIITRADIIKALME